MGCIWVSPPSQIVTTSQAATSQNFRAKSQKQGDSNGSPIIAWCECQSIFFNEQIFIQLDLDELDKLDKIAHAWIRIHFQSRISTENVLV